MLDLNALKADLKECQKNARTRTLYFGGCSRHKLTQAIEIFDGLCSLPNIEVVVHGGALPNSYRYAGQSTWVKMQTNDIGEISYTCERTYAPKRRYGGGWEIKATFEGKKLIYI
jgi:hypothetical protein